MKLYRFSPIKDDATIMSAFEHIYKELLELKKQAVNEDWPIYSLKIFAHYEDEYKFLLNWISLQGTKDLASSNTSYYVKPKTAFMVAGNTIPYIGLRIADPYRSQVGCGDFEIDNYAKIKQKYLSKSKNLREIEHSRYEMLELYDPDIDVLGYIVKD